MVKHRTRKKRKTTINPGLVFGAVEFGTADDDDDEGAKQIDELKQSAGSERRYKRQQQTLTSTFNVDVNGNSNGNGYIIGSDNGNGNGVIISNVVEYNISYNERPIAANYLLFQNSQLSLSSSMPTTTAPPCDTRH